MNRKLRSKIAAVMLAAVVISPAGFVMARRGHGHNPVRGRRPAMAQVTLTAQGEQLAAQYSATLEKLVGEISQALPLMDPGMTHPFMAAYNAETAVTPYHYSNPRFMQAIKRTQQAAAPLLSMAGDVLSNNSRDGELAEASIIAEATPRGLAGFAQQSDANKALISQLLSDPSLMAQMQAAGGARNDNYGLTMQIYRNILKASKLARKGVLQRLALATALSQKPVVVGIGQNKAMAYDPVKRYLAYQDAYLKGELDPYFPTFSTWQYRYVIDEPRSDAEIAWTRMALQNYYPSTVFDRNYLEIVHTDLGYSHQHLGLVPGNFISQLIVGGGVCGARAWVGRLSERAFGIPVWGVKQRGHAAMTMWDPKGWPTPFGSGFDWNWWGNTSGNTFLLDEQARQYPSQYLKVVRAKCIAAALGETPPDGRVPGTGGLWYALAECQARAIIASGKPTLVVPSLKQLMQKYGPTLAEKVQMQPVPKSDMQVSIDSNGVIYIPVVAGNIRKSTGGATVTKSFSGGLQMHLYNFRTHAPKLIYTFSTPLGGVYNLTAMINALRPEATPRMGGIPHSYLNVVVNHHQAASRLKLFWTDGLWKTTQPIEVRLNSGNNVIEFNQGSNYQARAKRDVATNRVHVSSASADTNFHAVSIKGFILKPSR